MQSFNKFDKLFNAENISSCSGKYRTDEKRIETCMKVHFWNLSRESERNRLGQCTDQESNFVFPNTRQKVLLLELTYQFRVKYF